MTGEKGSDAQPADSTEPAAPAALDTSADDSDAQLRESAEPALDTSADDSDDRPFMPVALQDEFKGSQPPENEDTVVYLTDREAKEARR